jgi:hypothetical protein
MDNLSVELGAVLLVFLTLVGVLYKRLMRQDVLEADYGEFKKWTRGQFIEVKSDVRQMHELMAEMKGDVKYLVREEERRSGNPRNPK